jgi:dTDP-4-dehydrorhamnose reductase
MRVAVTGAGGRLGRALLAELARASWAGEVLAWDLPEHDLDDPGSAERLVGRARPDVVIHAAAWTDTDGCARDPDLALRRNGTAVGEMAGACVRHGAALVAVSTNEVFDGRRTDRRPYGPDEPPAPGNPYGAAKRAGEVAALKAFQAAGGGEAGGGWPALAIVRTAWLFGPAGNDFPAKILAAAERARAQDAPLRVTLDEIGTPTYAPDLAAAMAALLREAAAGSPSGRSRLAGIHHVVNSGMASRAEWAREVLRLAHLHVPIEEVTMATWPRPSTPPAWGVLRPTPLPDGPLRDWRAALAEHMAGPRPHPNGSPPGP